jgi:hypothetical protein
MLSKTFEFLRIADVQPSAEKVKLRTQSATEILAQVDAEESNEVLLSLLQGIIGGLEKSPFTQESPVVTMLIKEAPRHPFQASVLSSEPTAVR